MAEHIVRTTIYRGHNIAINPTGGVAGAKTDAFSIMGPTSEPIVTTLLYAHPDHLVKKYASEIAARDAAMTMAEAWIDKYIARAAN